MSTHYTVRIGGYTASDRAQDGDRLLLQLRVEQTMDGSGGRCNAELAGAQFDAVAVGDPVEVALDGGDGAVTVFSGQVCSTGFTATTQRVEAQTALAGLARAELERAYESVTLDFIVKDLLQQGGATAGTVCKGPEVPSYAVHRQPRLLGQVWRLAAACGADVYTAGDGKVQVATPDQSGAEHRLRFGQDIRELDLQAVVLPFDSIELWGEGAASAKGSDKAHWLSTDLSGVCGKAAVDDAGVVSTGRLGQRPLRLRDGALRAGGATEDSARARLAWLAARRVGGRIEVNGAPAVQPGDTVRIDKLPSGHGLAGLLASALRVRGVRHWLDRESGLVTRLMF